MRLLLALLFLSGCSRTGTDAQALGPSGGVRERDGARVDVPAGALTAESVIAIARVSTFPPPPTGRKFVNGVFAFTPAGQEFEQVVFVRVPASPGEVLLKSDPGGPWTLVENATFADGMLSAWVRRFSLFAASTSTVTAERIFFSDGASIRSMDADGNTLATLSPGVMFDKYPTGVAVDRVAQLVYWTDNVTDRITRVAYNGTGVTIVYTAAEAAANPTGIAVDPAHGKLFWAEGSRVRSSSLDGANVTTIITGAAGNVPSSVALDATNQRVYWTDNGTDTVNRADYNGANSAVIYAALDGTSNPRGLAIDVVANKLFWAEGANIRTSGLDGTLVTTAVIGVAGTNVPDAVAVNPTRKLLYWTDNGTDSVHVAPYTGTAPRELFHNADKFSNPQGVAVDPGN